MRKRIGFALVAAIAAAGIGYGRLQAPVDAEPSGPKNVIFLIGDGMGPQQMGLLHGHIPGYFQVQVDQIDQTHLAPRYFLHALNAGKAVR